MRRPLYMPLVAFIIFVTATSALSAQPDEVCTSAGSSLEETACARNKLKRAEAALNARYKQLLLELDEITKSEPERLGQLKSRLVLAQRAWVSFREAQCKAVEVWYTKGTLQGALYYDCMRSHAEERLKELNSFTDYRT
jgi:uncharacterized protein YecT (DUF1311 family)